MKSNIDIVAVLRFPGAPWRAPLAVRVSSHWAVGQDNSFTIALTDTGWEMGHPAASLL